MVTIIKIQNIELGKISNAFVYRSIIETDCPGDSLFMLYMYDNKIKSKLYQ